MKITNTSEDGMYEYFLIPTFHVVIIQYLSRGISPGAIRKKKFYDPILRTTLEIDLG